ncbi:SDR family NAD(P)-dependent oxidoreductase [Clostridium sp. Marseille-P299]|uniref:SDR family NAD(P)-dependent oxidoreductase n=1 Tax=Clostridium sp. Marseille-P299 TaxID=1805477 RepID=UPI00082A646C|nr:3-oxoacyl-ACP reductase family protein [Clostridium sp. Marseille-P299]
MKLLEGKVAIVTGGSRGIGYAIVKKFLEHGAKVVLCGSREETAVAAVKALIKENNEYEVSGVWPDLCNPAEVKKCFTEIKEKYGAIDILVNNAGVSSSESIYTYKPEDFARTIDLNVNAVFYCSQAVAGFMKEQGGGVILNTSSMVSLYGQRSGCAYPASKYAVNGMTKSLARELGPDNIRVNTVAPGITNTDMVAKLPDEVIKPLISMIPLKRIGESEDCANAFLYLASDLASYVTGEILSVDGATIF